MFGSGLPAFLLIGLGMPELLVILVIIILIFGTSRIASLGKGLGEGIRNFKKGIKDEDEDEPGDQPKAS
jgi:sec-independent protein translocase protein TatA